MPSDTPSSNDFNRTTLGSAGNDVPKPHEPAAGDFNRTKFDTKVELDADAATKAHEADLQKQVNKLREDIAGVTSSIKGLASSSAGSARSQAYALRDDLRTQGERYLRQAQDTANEFEDQFSERVRAEPIKYVLIAAAAGYLYARIFH